MTSDDRTNAAEAVPGSVGRVYLVMLAAAILVIVYSVTTFNGNMKEAERGAEVAAGNFAQLMEQYLRGTVRLIDAALTASVDEFGRQAAAGGVVPSVFSGFLERQQARLPEVSALRAADALGTIRFGKGVAGTAVDISDRDYFQRHRERDSGALDIPKPIFARLSQQWVVAFSRRLNDVRGDFAGIVYANLALSQLTAVFSSVDIGKHGVIVLFDADGNTIARYPEPKGPGSTIGVKLASPEFLALRQQGREVGTYTAQSTTDGVRRTYSYRKVEGFPLFVMVGLAADDYLLTARTEAVQIAVFVGLFLVVKAILCVILWRSSRRQRRHTGQLRAALDTVQHAREAADAASRAKSDFLAMMSHEIRTPITGVLGMADLLLRTPLDEEQARYVHALSSSTRTLLVILNDVLDSSKIEAGKLELEAMPFDLRDAVHHVVALNQGSASAKGLTFESSLAADLPARVSGDPARIKQILYNLASNAIKFTERGGVRLRLSLQARVGDAVVLLGEVEDTGIGIAADQRDGLFQPFSQVDPSSSRRFGGTGLGLAITRRLVELMGGEIGVDSEPGQGCRFWFTLRLQVASEPAAEPAGPVVAAPARRSLHILLAEDNRINQMLVRAMLLKSGHTVKVVADGRAAVAAVEAGSFDVVLMDMQMPEMDGEEATRAIRALPPPRNRLPVLALTADVLPEHRDRYLAAGVDDLVTKPIDWKVLNAALDSLTSTAGAGR